MCILHHFKDTLVVNTANSVRFLKGFTTKANQTIVSSEPSHRKTQPFSSQRDSWDVMLHNTCMFGKVHIYIQKSEFTLARVQ
jgi:hypothetical protein